MHRQGSKGNTTQQKTRIPSLMRAGCFFILACILAAACDKSGGHTVGNTHGTTIVMPHTRDSMPQLHSVGVSTLISDSGVIRYRLVAEEWDIYTPANQSATWKFIKGLLMLRLDTHLNVDLYVQADTAYLHQQKVWELRGRVRIRNVEGTRFNTEELFWDLSKHEMWNHAHMTIITPERTLQGTEFQSNESMTRYSVMNSSGDFPMSDAEGETSEEQPDTTATTSPTVATPASEPQPAPTGNLRRRTLSSPGATVLEPAPTKYDFLMEK